MKVKKLTIIGICLLAAALLLAGCGLQPFDIQGSWKVTGGQGFDQAQVGGVVTFSNGHCNIYSPFDSYALTKSGSDYQLSITGVLGGDSSYTVKVTDNNRISVYDGGQLVAEMQRSGS
ncbi:MAG: hypothetical protein FWD65_03855 [Coriobacteriia bacterium]|nr:hypothetical protein [Coriobacteriia bacterium]